MLSKIISAGLLLVLSSVSILSATTINAQSFRFTPWNPSSRPISVFTTNTSYGEEYNYSYDYNTSRPLISSSTSCVGSDMGYVVPPLMSVANSFVIKTMTNYSGNIYANVIPTGQSGTHYKTTATTNYNTGNSYCNGYGYSRAVDFNFYNSQFKSGAYRIEICQEFCSNSTRIGFVNVTLSGNNYNIPQPKKPTYNNNNSQPKQMDYQYMKGQRYLQYQCINSKPNQNSIYLRYYPAGQCIPTSQSTNNLDREFVQYLDKYFAQYPITTTEGNNVSALAKRKVITKASNGYWMIDFDVINSAMSSSNFDKTNNTTNYPTCQQSINAQNFFGYGYSDCTVETQTYTY